MKLSIFLAIISAAYLFLSNIFGLGGYPLARSAALVFMFLPVVLLLLKLVNFRLPDLNFITPITHIFETNAKRLIGFEKTDDFGEKLASKIDDYFSNNKDSLKRGDLLATAQARYPESEFPELYVEIPEDIRRPIIVDGRVCTGELLNHLAPRRISRKIIEDLFRLNLRRCATLMNHALIFSALIAGIVSWGTWKASNAQIEVNFSQLNFRESSIPMSAVIARQDIWTEVEANAVVKEIVADAEFNLALRKWSAKAVALVVSILTFCFLIFGVAGVFYIFLMYKSLAPRSIKGATQKIVNSDDALLTESKEAIVRWKKRLEKRRNETNAYRKQIEISKRDKSPLITLGHGTGTLLFRGALSGYIPGQPVQMSLTDLNTHMAITGTTGSGKSASVLVPLMHQVIQSKSEGQSISLLVMDGKGVLHHDAATVATTRNAEIRVIGCKEGQFGVDLFDGLEPTIVSTALNDVMNQLAGGSSDPYWRQMAALILSKAAIVARAYELTPRGRSEMEKSGERWYSPVGIYKLALSARLPSGPLASAVAELNRLFDTEGEERAAVARYLTAELDSAIDFLREDCVQFPEQTWGSFVAQITQVLSGFTAIPALRSRFGVGGKGTLAIERIWDDNVITAVDLSPMEYGMAARIAAMLFKARVFAHSHARYLKNPDIGKSSKLVIVMDEAHLLLSSGSALSEDSFASICRAFGVSLVLSFQTLSTLYSAFGESAGGQRTKTLLDNLRTKIFLSSEGLETATYIRELAGKALRSTVSDLDQYESYAARRFESNDFSMDDVVMPFSLTDKTLAETLKGGEPASISAQTKPIFKMDMKFYAANITGGSRDSTPTVDWTEKLKSIQWRAEDKRNGFLTQGNSEEDLVHSDEALTFGRGLMLAFVQRAGHIRMDVVNTEKVFTQFNN